MSLEILLDMEVLDSKVEAAFEEKSHRTKGSSGMVFIDQIL